jgi:hypothetical protein
MRKSGSFSAQWRRSLLCASVSAAALMSVSRAALAETCGPEALSPLNCFGAITDAIPANTLSPVIVDSKSQDGVDSKPQEGPVDPKVLSRLEELLRKVGEGSSGAVVQTLATLGQTVNAVAMVAGGLSQNIIAEALEGDMVPDHTALAPISVSTPGAIDSLFMVSGYKALRHDGFDISSSFAPADGGKTPGFDEQNYGLTVAGRFDGSDILGAAPHSVTLGVLGNYTHTDIDVDGVGGGKGGSADIDSWSVGAYGLVTDGGKYGLVTVVGTFGSPQTSNFVIPAEAEFNNFGFATSAVAGVLVPMGGATKLDLRGGFNYVYGESEDYRDSAGILFSDGRLEEFSGTVSARLFSVMHFDSYNIRPFVQTGLTHRFSYENELTIDGEDFSFDDADTSVFARAGFDFDIGRTTQAYLAVRGDASEDFEAIAAQVGVTFRLD